MVKAKGDPYTGLELISAVISLRTVTVGSEKYLRKHIVLARVANPERVKASWPILLPAIYIVPKSLPLRLSYR